jgi:hypothetical protein
MVEIFDQRLTKSWFMRLLDVFVMRPYVNVTAGNLGPSIRE